MPDRPGTGTAPRPLLPEMPADVRVLLITGAMGAGKTTLAEAVGDLLIERDLPSAMIDLDWLGQVHPMTDDDPVAHRLIIENLAAVWPNYRRRGVRYLVLARLVRDRDTWQAYRRVIPEARWTLARATAPQPVIEERLVERHRNDVSPAILQRHLDWSRRATARLDEAELADLDVQNTGPLRGVAEELLQAWLAL